MINKQNTNAENKMILRDDTLKSLNNSPKYSD